MLPNWGSVALTGTVPDLGVHNFSSWDSANLNASRQWKSSYTIEHVFTFIHRKGKRRKMLDKLWAHPMFCISQLWQDAGAVSAPPLCRHWTRSQTVGATLPVDSQVTPTALVLRLAPRCMEEFFKQGDKEQEQGLDFSPLCDRQNTMVPQSQIGDVDVESCFQEWTRRYTFHI